MAYCVHCGVKLHDAEPKCALCGAELADPLKPHDPSIPKPFPVRTPEQALRISRKYAMTLLSVLLLLPAAGCLLLDFLAGGISWSIYPAGVLALSWIVVAVPLLLPRYRVYSTILITGGALAGYLLMTERLSGASDWFLPIVFPALALFIVMICVCVALVRKYRARTLLVIVAALVEVGVLCLAVELLCVGFGVALRWSPFALAPCFFMALLLFVISRNRALSEELKRRLHF